jgi:hypothetical protein
MERLLSPDEIRKSVLILDVDTGVAGKNLVEEMFMNVNSADDSSCPVND